MDIVLLATADWDNPLWTNKQHLASRWGRLGHRVLYVESLGLRRPSLSGRDLSRMWRRLRRANRLRQVGPGVWVLSPLLLPLQRLSSVRALNRAWLERLLRRSVERLGLVEPVLWTYNPLTLDFAGRLPWRRTVYHCVDELTGAPGMPAALLEQKERQLLAHSDLVVVSAKPLAESRRPHAPRIEYVPNAADFEHFARANDPATQIPDELLAIPQPRLGFVGAVSDYKLDLERLFAVFSERNEWQLVLIGPVGEGQPETKIGKLESLANVHFLGPRAYERIPSYIRGFDVCLLPNRMNRYTRHMFPLKFFEYLAAGKPVVMSPLPALQDYWRLAFVASEADEGSFARAIERALAEPPEAPVREARMEEARRHDWDVNARLLLRLLRELGGEASRGP